MPLGDPRLLLRHLTALSRRFFVRLLVPTLALTVAVMAVVVYLVTSSSATALTDATSSHVEDLARAASARLDAWNQLVQAELSGYGAALEASSTPLSGTSAEMGRLFFARSSAFSEIALVNSQGQVVASSGGLTSGLSFTGSSWLTTAAKEAIITPIQEQAGQLDWYAAQPVTPGASASPGSWWG